MKPPDDTNHMQLIQKRTNTSSAREHEVENNFTQEIVDFVTKSTKINVEYIGEMNSEQSNIRENTL